MSFKESDPGKLSAEATCEQRLGERVAVSKATGGRTFLALSVEGPSRVGTMPMPGCVLLRVLDPWGPLESCPEQCPVRNAADLS